MLNTNKPLYLKAENTEAFYLDGLVMTLLEKKQWPATNIHSMSTGSGLEDVTFEQLVEIYKNVGLQIDGIEESSGIIKDDEDYAPSGMTVVASNEDHVTHLLYNGRYFGLSTWSKTVEQARILNKKIFDQLPQEDEDPNTVEFKFWKLGPQNHAYPTNKKLLCPRFADIKDNYTQDVVKQIEALIGLKAPDDYGKIILWHGPPGNGKTYLIRALTREWASKHGITPEVIIDPETFFSNSYYLDSLVTSQINDSVEDETFRLIIIEDYASIVSTGCRNNPGFARLLNTTDGLIGQGQRLIFLLTTNEPLDMIDPAVLRPGRCLHRMEILPMTEKEGIEWLEKKDALHLASEIDGRRELSLADLYAILHGNPFKNNTPSSSFGF